MTKRTVLKVSLHGDRAQLGTVPAKDVAQLILQVERVIARAASVVTGRPSKRPGRRESVVARASELLLVGIEAGSVTPVLEIPVPDRKGKLSLDDIGLAEASIAQICDILSAEIDGHPYVVESLAELSTKLQVGDRYERIDFDVGSAKRPLGASLTPDVAKRINERRNEDLRATREGMLVGTLVEADFEAFSARLRSPEGSRIAVSFDPEMADDIQRALREPTKVMGWISYDPENQMARSISIRSVSRGEQILLDIDPDDFQTMHSFQELQAAQGVSGMFSVEEIHDTESSAGDLDSYGRMLEELYE